MQKICNNLYSRFLQTEKSDLEKMRSGVAFKVVPYENDFKQIVQFLNKIEKNLIQRLLSLVNLSPSLAKVFTPQ